jgi:hypothetical protein
MKIDCFEAFKKRKSEFSNVVKSEKLCRGGIVDVFIMVGSLRGQRGQSGQ